MVADYKKALKTKLYTKVLKRGEEKIIWQTIKYVKQQAEIVRNIWEYGKISRESFRQVWMTWRFNARVFASDYRALMIAHNPILLNKSSANQFWNTAYKSNLSNIISNHLNKSFYTDKQKILTLKYNLKSL